MSTSKDESSLQLEKLLSSNSRTENSAHIPLSSKNELSTPMSEKDFSFVSVEAHKLLSSNHDVNDATAKESESSIGIKPDICYSWLQPPSDGISIGKQSKQGSVSSDDSSSSSSLPMPQAPDGGWGWFVVLGAFLITTLCDGLSYCFGVLYSELLVQFGESRSKTSMVGAIFFGVAMMLGPLASALTTRFGCRTMTIFGGMLSATGLFLSQFATSIEMLCFTFSIVVGTGFSFCYITSVVIVAFYFDKRRALATGFAVCGTGVGTFTFAPLMDYLIGEYGWRGLFLILSGLSLNLVMCGMLFRPLHFTDSERWEMLLQEFNKIPYSREDIEMPRSRYPSDSIDTDSDEETLEEEARTLSVLSLPTFVNTDIIYQPPTVLMEALKNSKNPHHTLQRYMKNAMLQYDQQNMMYESCRKIGSPVDRQKFTLSITSPTVKSTDFNAKTEDAVDSLPSSLLDGHHKLNVSNGKPKSAVSDSEMETKPLKFTEKPVKKPSTNYENPRKEIIEKESKTKTDGKNAVDGKTGSKVHDAYKIKELPYKRNEYSGMSNILTDKGCEKEGKSVVKRIGGVHIGRHNALGIHLPLYRTDIFYRRLLRHYPHQKMPKPCVLSTSCPEIKSIAPETERHAFVQGVLTFFEEACEIMKSMVEFRLFLNPFFIVFVISNFIFYFWSDIPYMYAADHAMNIGIEQRQASFLLSIVGIFNTIGQVVFGCVGDMDINLLNIYAIISSIGGLFVAIVPFMSTYVGMCVVYAFFGFFISVSYPLTTVLLVNYLGVAKLTNAYGLLMLMQGIANLFGPPFAGWVSDRTGSYDATFHMSGIFYALSGLVLFFVYIPKCREYACPRKEPLDYSVDTEDPV